MTEYCVASDEGVVADGFYSESDATAAIARIRSEYLDADDAEGDNLVVAPRADYDEDGNYNASEEDDDD